MYSFAYYVLILYYYFVFQQSILSLNRSPSKLVIICDERNADLEGLKTPNVTVRVSSGLKLEDAYQFLRSDSTFNQEGNLYLVLLGIHSFLNLDTKSICENLSCQESLSLPIGLTRASIQLAFRYVVHQAVNLHRCLMIHSKNNNVIFGELFPVDLKSYFASVVRTHTNLFGGKETHKWTEPSNLHCEYFNRALEKYNTWTKAFNKYMGYLACSPVSRLDKNFTIVNGKLHSENIQFMSNGFTLNKSAKEAIFKYQEKFCRKINVRIQEREVSCYVS